MPFSGKRLAQARAKFNLSQAALAKRLKVSPGAVGQWEAGHSEPESKRLEEIAKLLEISTDFLLTGKELKPSPEFDRSEMPAMHNLPVLSNIAAAHLPAHSKSRETILVNSKFARANHYCLTVKGQSMRPTIYEGDTVVIEKTYYKLDPIIDDFSQADKTLWKSLKLEVVAASIDGNDPVLKRLLVTDRKDTGFKIWLAGDNRTTDQIEVTRESSLEIFGIVRQIIRDPKNFE